VYRKDTVRSSFVPGTPLVHCGGGRLQRLMESILLGVLYRPICFHSLSGTGWFSKWIFVCDSKNAESHSDLPLAIKCTHITMIKI